MFSEGNIFETLMSVKSYSSANQQQALHSFSS